MRGLVAVVRGLAGVAGVSKGSSGASNDALDFGFTMLDDLYLCLFEGALTCGSCDIPMYRPSQRNAGSRAED